MYNKPSKLHLDVPKQKEGIAGTLSPVSSLTSNFLSYDFFPPGNGSPRDGIPPPVVKDKTEDAPSSNNNALSSEPSLPSPRTARRLFDLDCCPSPKGTPKALARVKGHHQQLRRTKSDFEAIIASRVRKGSVDDEAEEPATKKLMCHKFSQPSTTSDKENLVNFRVISGNREIQPKTTSADRRDANSDLASSPPAQKPLMALSPPSPSPLQKCELLTARAPEDPTEVLETIPGMASGAEPFQGTPLGPKLSSPTQRRHLRERRRLSVTVQGWLPGVRAERPATPPTDALPPRQPRPLRDPEAIVPDAIPVEYVKDGLKFVDASTVRNLLDGKYEERYLIVDCRFEFEFEGGHIRDAVNLVSTPCVEKHFFSEEVKKCSVVVFHCEFSSVRGPKLCRHLREHDRELHRDSYPELSFPQIFVLQGGYKEFFERYPEYCTPSAYVEMVDPRFSQERKVLLTAMKRDKKHLSGRVRSFSDLRSLRNECNSFGDCPF